MPAKAKGGKGGKGKALPLAKGGKGRIPPKVGGALRHKKKIIEETHLGKPSLRRLCRRAGIRRISAQVYDPIRAFADFFLERVLQNALVYAQFKERRTIQLGDVLFALKKRDMALWGVQAK